MKTIASYAKPDDAFLARARLEGSGVAASIRDEHTISTDWFYSNAIGGVRVEVEDEDVARAREILELPPIEKGILTCPRCGSENVRLRELSAWTAMSLFLGFPLPVKTRQADCISCHKTVPAADCIEKPSP